MLKVEANCMLEMFSVIIQSSRVESERRRSANSFVAKGRRRNLNAFVAQSEKAVGLG